MFYDCLLLFQTVFLAFVFATARSVQDKGVCVCVCVCLCVHVCVCVRHTAAVPSSYRWWNSPGVSPHTGVCIRVCVLVR